MLTAAQSAQPSIRKDFISMLLLLEILGLNSSFLRSSALDDAAVIANNLGYTHPLLKKKRAN